MFERMFGMILHSAELWRQPVKPALTFHAEGLRVYQPDFEATYETFGEMAVVLA
jgi:hypothetical protein